MGKKLYIANLPFSATEDSLTNKFSECGMVESVKVMTNQETGNSTGFAYVEMSNGSAAQDVITRFNGVDLDGQQMKITEAKPILKRNIKGW